MTTDHESSTCCRWVHYWAVLTVCATLVLLMVGSVVTTLRVGMADPHWPTYPWHLVLVSWEESGAGFLIEHSHRLAGYIVGSCMIVLAVGLWVTSPRWLGWLGLVALLGVIVQGLLGGIRVRLNERLGTDLAFLHGCFAQLVFGILVSLAVFTSSGWATAPQGPAVGPGGHRVRRWSLLTVGLVYLQIVLGAWIRHTGSPVGQRAHLLLAFGVVAAVTGLAWAVHETDPREKRLTRPVAALVILLVLQLLLGVETWILRTSSGWMLELRPQTVHQAMIRTAHVLVGSLTLAAAVVATLQAHRRTAWTVQPASDALQRLEGVA